MLMTSAPVLTAKICGRASAAASVVSPCACEVTQALALQETTATNEAGQTACCEGSSRKAEQKNLIAGHIVLRQEHIAGADIVIDPLAEGAIHDLLQRHPCRPYAPQVKNELG